MRSSRTNGKLLETRSPQWAGPASLSVQLADAALEARSWTGPELSTVREDRAQAGTAGPSGSKKGRDSWQSSVRMARDCSLAKARIIYAGSDSEVGVLHRLQFAGRFPLRFGLVPAHQGSLNHGPPEPDPTK